VLWLIGVVLCIGLARAAVRFFSRTERIYARSI